VGSTEVHRLFASVNSLIRS